MKTPHNLKGMYAVLDAYFNTRLRTLLDDPASFSDLRLAISEVHSGSVDEANAIVRESIATLKKIAGVE